MIEELLLGNIKLKDSLAYYKAKITYEKLPQGINGFVTKYKGINNIIINSNLSYYKRKKTIIHELIHIELNHLGRKDSFTNLEEIKEYEVKNYLDMLNDFIKAIKKYNYKEIKIFKVE